MCGRHAFLPRTLKIPVCYDRTSVALYRGGFADVWKGKHLDLDVAVKVLRTYSNSDLQKIIGVGCSLCSLPAHRHSDQACVEILQGGHDVENPSASECATSGGSDDDRDRVRDDIRVDVKRKHHRLREGASRRGPTPACTCCVRASMFPPVDNYAIL